MEYHSFSGESKASLLLTFAGYPSHLAVINDDKDGIVDTHEFHTFTRHTPISLALVLGKNEMAHFMIVEKCFDRKPIDAPIFGYPLLFLAARYCNEKVVHEVMERSDDLELVNRTEQTVVHRAAGNSDAEVMKLVLSMTTNIDKQDDQYQRPIHIAASENENPLVLQLLIEAGASLVSRGPESDFLCCAAENKSHLPMQVLLKAGMKLNLHDQSPVLRKACQNGSEAVLRFLLETNPHNDSFRFFFSVAATNPNPEPWRLLVKWNAVYKHVQSPLSFGAGYFLAFCNLLALTDILESGLDVKNLDGLVSAINNPDIRVLDMLERTGADLVSKLGGRMDTVAHFKEAFLWFFNRGVDLSFNDKGLPRRWFVNVPVLIQIIARGKIGCLNAEKIASIGELPEAAALFLMFDIGHGQIEKAIREENIPKIMTLVSYAESDIQWRRECSKNFHWAHAQFAHVQVEVLRERAMQVCTVLVDVSALELCEILSNTFAPFPCLAPFHIIWQLVTTIKHYRKQQ